MRAPPLAACACRDSIAVHVHLDHHRLVAHATASGKAPQEGIESRVGHEIVGGALAALSRGRGR